MNRPSRVSIEVHKGVEGPALYVMNALAVPCPKCKRPIDKACHSTEWRRVIERPPHFARERAAEQKELDDLSLLLVGVFGDRKCVGRPPTAGELHALVSAIWEAGYRKVGAHE